MVYLACLAGSLAFRPYSYGTRPIVAVPCSSRVIDLGKLRRNLRESSTRIVVRHHRSARRGLCSPGAARPPPPASCSPTSICTRTAASPRYIYALAFSLNYYDASVLVVYCSFLSTHCSRCCCAVAAADDLTVARARTSRRRADVSSLFNALAGVTQPSVHFLPPFSTKPPVRLATPPAASSAAQQVAHRQRTASKHEGISGRLSRHGGYARYGRYGRPLRPGRQ